MNDNRRRLIQQAVDLVTQAQEEEQESFDNYPENLQASEKGEAMEMNAADLEEAADILLTVLER